jgi:hypothetical protein
MNWLNHTCNNNSQKQKILSRHRQTSDTYKTLANFIDNKDDILIDIRHIMILGTNESI